MQMVTPDSYTTVASRDTNGTNSGKKVIFSNFIHFREVYVNSRKDCSASILRQRHNICLRIQSILSETTNCMALLHKIFVNLIELNLYCKFGDWGLDEQAGKDAFRL